MSSSNNGDSGGGGGGSGRVVVVRWSQDFSLVTCTFTKPRNWFLLKGVKKVTGAFIVAVSYVRRDSGPRPLLNKLKMKKVL